jgi:hypothetical protein
VDKSKAKQLQFGFPHVTKTLGWPQREVHVSLCLLIPCFPPSKGKVPNLLETGVFDSDYLSPL